MQISLLSSPIFCGSALMPRFFSALEDALKARQLLGEFDFNGGGNHARIVGFREFVFTHDVSSIANFFSLQVGVTARPLRLRKRNLAVILFE